MQLLISLFVAASPPYVRVAPKSAPPALRTSLVWVFFTDKGIATDAQYAAATAALNRAAPGRPRQADFDDLPVRGEYVRSIERMGARLRTVSNWLNAASFAMTPELAAEVHARPFVYDVRPLGTRSEPDWDALVPIRQPEPRRTRGLDTADAHRFYGAAWDQCNLMGVPAVADNSRGRGYYGDGVRLAIFDTGLKLKNRAVQGLNIYRQHDFISGDHLYFGGSAIGWTPAQIPNLRYFGLVRDPVVAASPPDSAAGQDERLLLAFVADSFNYGYSLPQRALWYSRSEDRGATWTDPELLYLTGPDTRTIENLTTARRRYITYLAFDEASEVPGGGTNASVCVGWFIGADWFGQRNIGAGRWPHIAAVEDTLYISYVFGDSVLVFNRASIAMAEPAWGLPVQIRPGEPVVDPQVCPGVAGHVNIICSGLHSGRIYRYQSADGGVAFTRMDDLAPSAASMPRLFGDGPDRLLLYRDNSLAPFSRLMVMRSATWGDEWYVPLTVAESTLTVGGYTAAISGPDTASQVTVIYESQGLLHRASTPLWGGTWSGPHVVIDTAGFCHQPTIASIDSATLAGVWFKRGDDNTVWESSDTLRFSRDQSDHGTRMASLIAGWQPYSLVGVAPGVDLLVAKTEFHKARSSRRYEYNMEEDTYIQALEWAEAQGADIVTTSLGYRGWYRDDQFDGRTAPVSVAVALAARRGLLVVTAMGNRDSTFYPWPEPYIVAPGDADGIITAGGTERNGLPWRGTGTGPTADGRIKPDFVALSDTVAVASPDSENFLDGSVGTSCATALIAGACALLKEAHPDWTAESIIAALKVTSTRSSPNCTLGYGIPRIDSAFKLFPPSPDAPGLPGDEISLIFPNPFTPASQPKVYFALGLTRSTPRASISIFTTSGTLVDTVPLRGDLLTRPGRYGAGGTPDDIALLERLNSWWDGKNGAGRPAAAGLYIAALQTTFGKATACFTLVR